MNLKYLVGVASLGLLFGFLGYKLVGMGVEASVIPTPSLVPVYSIPAITNSAPAPFAKVVEHLTVQNSQVLYLEGEVDQNAINLAEEVIAMGESGKPIWLLINSPGGSVLAGARLVSAIQESKVPVYTVCTVLCASMAAIIHQYGTKRYMTTRSLLMFHNAAMGLSGQLPEMLVRLNMMNSYTQKMDAYIAQRSGQSLEAFNTRFSHELWMDDDESLKGHYIDGVVSFLIKGKPANVSIFGLSSVNTFLNFRWK